MPHISTTYSQINVICRRLVDTGVDSLCDWDPDLERLLSEPGRALQPPDIDCHRGARGLAVHHTCVTGLYVKCVCRVLSNWGQVGHKDDITALGEVEDPICSWISQVDIGKFILQTIQRVL